MDLGDKIEPQENTSITEPIDDLELGDYTILAGENNAGKTHLMNAIISKIGKENTIYIPAESIDAKLAAKTGARDDSMRSAISKLLEIRLPKDTDIEGDFEDLFKDIEKTFDSFGVKNTELKLESREFSKKDFEDIITDSVAKRILEHSTVDKWGDENEEIDIDKVGQGVQRLIIASILQEVGKIQVEGDEILVLFEEPEIYLHPQLKKRLYDSLFDLSNNPKISVVISTHDPQFIELGKDQKIFKVFRNDEKNDSTDVELINEGPYLDYKSDSEINYLIFKLPTKAYFLELYDHIKRKEGFEDNSYKELDDYIFSEFLQNEGLNQDCTNDNEKDITPVTKIRHSIAHGLDISDLDLELKDSISHLINFIER